MRRWNGWGDETIRYEMSAQVARVVEALVGPGAPPRMSHPLDLVGAEPLVLWEA